MASAPLPPGGVAHILSSQGGAAGGASGTPAKSNDSQEFLEVNSVSLEWKLSNLKQLFDGSKGETKSKCVKSAFFGNGRWQIFFYPNSGHDQYCSLYLSCQPTPEECEKGALAAGFNPQTSSGGKVTDPTQVPWVREGLFKFTFEIKSYDRRTVFKAMEANDHAFSHEARNWGWAQYWRRNDAYYNNPAAKFADAFLICCTIVYSPTPPSPPPPLTRRSVPNDLLDAYASLFDDPHSSDVCFRIIKRKRSPEGQRLRLVYTIYASRKILGKRSEYFQSMFEGGFAEGRSPVQSTSSFVQDAPPAAPPGSQGDLMVMGSPSSSPKRRASRARSASMLGLNDDDDDEDSDSMLGLEGGEGSQLWSESDEDISDNLDMLDGESSDVETSPAVKAKVAAARQGSEVDRHQLLSSDGVTPPAAPRAASVGSQAFRPANRASMPLAEDQIESSEAVGMAKGESAGDLVSVSMMQESSSSTAGGAAAITASTEAQTTPSRAASAPAGGRAGKDGTSAISKVAPSSGLRTPVGMMAANNLANTGGRRTPDDDVRMVGVQEDEPMFDAITGPFVALGDGTIEGKVSAAGAIRRQRKKRETEREVFMGRADRKKKDVGRGEADGRKAVVTVTDASYHTFRALLYYLYTDAITFAPLASTYLCARDAAATAGNPFPYATRKEFVKATFARIPSVAGQPEGPGACSAKAIYRLADKIGLPDLKARAFEHITRSLTPQNIPMEVFSSFTSAYEEVRKVEIDFMLRSWNDVRDSTSMRTVLNSLRDGRHFPGFADVWRLLLANLEYRPKVDVTAITGAGADAATA